MAHGAVPGGRLHIVIDEGACGGRSREGRVVVRADDDDGEVLVRLEDGVSDDGNGEGLREVAGLKDELAARG